MEDGNNPIKEIGEDYEEKTTTKVSEKSNISRVNGHSLNGIGLAACNNSETTDKVFGQYSSKYLSDIKLCGQHYHEHIYGRDERSVDIKCNRKTSLNHFSVNQSAINKQQRVHNNNLISNRSENIQHINRNIKCDEYTKKLKTDNVLQFKVDRKEALRDRHTNTTLSAVRFKCLRCKSASFKSLGLLKEHQRECDVSYKRIATDAQKNAPAIQKNASRKVYMCSVCSTYYENWNLFLHMREVHNRHICLFCLGMFSKAERLASHLIVKHDVKENKFSDVNDFFSVYSGSLLLMCCYCDKVHTEKDNFAFHDCVRISKCPIDINNDLKCQKVDSICNQTQIATTINVLPVASQKNETANGLSSSMGEVNKYAETSIKKTLVAENNEETGKKQIIKSVKEDNCKNSEPPGSLNDVKQLGMEFEMQRFGDDELDNEVQNITKNFHDADVKKMNESHMYTEDNVEEVNNEFKHSDNNLNEIESTNNYGYISSSQFQQRDKVLLKLKHAVTPTVNKHPKRNRRPPKRYEYEDDIGIKYDNRMVSENSDNFEVHEDHSIEIPIPKLKVKLPKLVKNIVSDNENSYEIDESHQVTEDLSEMPVVNIDKEYLCDVMKCDTSSEVYGIKSPENNFGGEVDILIAGDEVPLTELTLDKPLDKYPINTLLKTFLTSTVKSCIYCNHARKIAVNGNQLALHFLSQHRFCATVNSITAEELLPETISAKLKISLCELNTSYLNVETYDSMDKVFLKDFDQVFECFQCYYATSVHKELYSHNRKMHQKTIMLCIMCKSTFYSYSELLCHLCPGTYSQNDREMSYRCCYCENDTIPSAFRLMIHLRKRHHACDVCLEKCYNQSKLSNHVWKHKLHHFCYRCAISYHNKADITKHLFWKHGTESVLCKKCLQKKWPHVYHFCIPPSTFICEECNLSFFRAVSLKVHKRIHNGDTPYHCTEQRCKEKFISKKILDKHVSTHKDNIEEAIYCDKPCFIDVVNAVKETTYTTESIIKENNNVTPVEVNIDKIKTKKAKRDRKHEDDKDNLLIDVNVPALNLSESDSDDSQLENSKLSTKRTFDFAKLQSNHIVEKQMYPKNEGTNLHQIWDNCNKHPTSTKKNEKEITIVKKHVCDSDHDYCLVPAGGSNETTESDSRERQAKLRDKKKKGKSKKKPQKEGYSSLSDSSSDSDSSCSCRSNCSCTSSDSSSTESSSSDSDSSNIFEQDLKTKHVSKRNRTSNKNSESSHTSAVDIMATGEPISSLLSAGVTIQIPESDLVTDETDTDEEFYDDHPQRIAMQLLAEKRNQILPSAESPLGNGSLSVEPLIPEKSKKHIKPKKKKKTKKGNHIECTVPPPLISAPVAQNTVRNKITISLQKNSVQLPDVFVLNNNIKTISEETDHKRASKRKRVPNKFYGYTSDEEYILKPQQPPKLEWRKEDLPSPTPSPSSVKSTAAPGLLKSVISSPEITKTIPPLIISKPVLTPGISSDESDSSVEGELKICQSSQSIDVNYDDNRMSVPSSPSRQFRSRIPFPKPAGARQAREGESVYCYCRCPYDEVSEMIACDADGCSIEWFHFECVGILVPPKGKWYCPQCESKLNIDHNY